MLCQHLVCQGEGYTLSFIVTHTHTHVISVQLHPWPVLQQCVCAGTPLSWLGSNTEVSHLAGWAGGPGSSCELFLGKDLGSTSLFSFCLTPSPLAHPGLLFSLIPLSGSLWLMSLSFNYQHCILSLAHTHTHKRTQAQKHVHPVYLALCKIACALCQATNVEVTFIDFTICSVLLI